MKVYDYVEWSFLEVMMLELGLPSTLVNWVMTCVTTMSYTILVNGLPMAPFKAKKGLMQGNPISPYLFAMSIEYLSMCLNSLIKDPNFGFYLQMISLFFVREI